MGDPPRPPEVLHSPHYTIPLIARVPVVVTLHDATFFTEPEMHTPVKGPFFRAATRLALRRAARCVVPSAGHARRARPGRGRRPDRARRRPPRCRPRRSSTRRREPRAVRDVRARLGLRRAGLRRLPRHAGAAQERPGPGPRLDHRRARPRRARRLWCSPVAGAGTPTSTRPLADVPAGLTLLRPGYLPIGELARVPRRRRGRRLPEPRRGLRPARPRGDGLRRRGADDPPAALPEVGGDAVAYTEPTRASIAGARRPARRPEPPRRAAWGRVARAARVHLGR